jgi:hypothetical protein
LKLDNEINVIAEVENSTHFIPDFKWYPPENFRNNGNATKAVIALSVFPVNIEITSEKIMIIKALMMMDKAYFMTRTELEDSGADLLILSANFKEKNSIIYFSPF